MSHIPPENPLFGLVLYLVSSSRLTLDETPIYGSLRLIEAASRLIEMAGATDGLEVDEFLQAARGSIERDKLLMIEDREGYTVWLTNLLRGFAEEATRRNLQQAPAVLSDK